MPGGRPGWWSLRGRRPAGLAGSGRSRGARASGQPWGHGAPRPAQANSSGLTASVPASSLLRRERKTKAAAAPPPPRSRGLGELGAPRKRQRGWGPRAAAEVGANPPHDALRGRPRLRGQVPGGPGVSRRQNSSSLRISRLLARERQRVLAGADERHDVGEEAKRPLGMIVRRALSVREGTPRHRRQTRGYGCSESPQIRAVESYPQHPLM